MNIAVRGNTRTATAAESGLNPALRVAFNSGAVMGLTVVGIGIVGVTVLWLIFGNPNVIAGFGFGASSIALFARVGGGILHKSRGRRRRPRGQGRSWTTGRRPAQPRRHR